MVCWADVQEQQAYVLLYAADEERALPPAGPTRPRAESRKSALPRAATAAPQSSVSAASTAPPTASTPAASGSSSQAPAVCRYDVADTELPMRMPTSQRPSMLLPHQADTVPAPAPEPLEAARLAAEKAADGALFDFDELDKLEEL